MLSPLLVRPLTENGFEIVAGAPRYRAAQMAEVATVPISIVHLSDSAALEAQLVENLIRSDVHPDGGGAEVQGASRLGRANLHGRADCGQDGQTARVCRATIEVDGPRMA